MAEHDPKKIITAARYAHSLGYTVMPIGPNKRPHFEALKRVAGNAQWSRLRGLTWDEVAPAFDPLPGFGSKIPITAWGVEWKEHAGCFDFDSHEVFDEFLIRAREAGLGDVVARCLEGYSVKTPRGHRFAVTCRSGVPGSSPLAEYYTGELTEKGKPKKQELIGFKGRGGYTVEDPSFDIHPLGDYGPQRGDLTTICEVSSEELQGLLDLAHGFDKVGGLRARIARPARLPGAPDGGITAEHRWRPERPCPVCGGVQQKGRDERHCYGFQHPRNPAWAYCTETPYEGATATENGAYLHRLRTKCPCGESHGAVVVVQGDDWLEEDLRALDLFEELGLTYVHGNRNAFVWDDRGVIHRQGKTDFFDSFRHERLSFLKTVEGDEDGSVEYELERVPAAPYWFHCVYDAEPAKGYTYNPAEPFMIVTPSGSLNMWRGYVFAPREGETGRFRAHLIRLCGVDRPHLGEYLWKLICWKLQNPTERPIVIPVIYGAQGTGKTTIARAIERVIHSAHTIELHDDQVLTGNFNAQLEGRAFVFFDEALFLLSPKAMARIKTLSSAPEIDLNPKYVSPYRVPNLASVWIFTNNREVRMESEDRRLFIVQADYTLRGDRGYFDALYEEIESNAFPSALLHAAQAEDLRGWHPEQARPDTEEMEAARLGNLRTVERWAGAMLEDSPGASTGVFHVPRGSFRWGKFVPVQELTESLCFFAANDDGRIENVTEAHPKILRRELQRLWGLSPAEGRQKNGRAHLLLPPLNVARSHWQAATGIDRDGWAKGELRVVSTGEQRGGTARRRVRVSKK